MPFLPSHANHGKCSDLVYTTHPALGFFDAQQSLVAVGLVIVSPFYRGENRLSVLGAGKDVEELELP